MRYKTHPCIRRYDNNPVLTSEKVPYNSLLVFNAGVTKFKNEYIMIFRNDYGDTKNLKITGTNLGLARSVDGLRWDVMPKPCLEYSDGDVRTINDPRLTVIENRLYITYAIIARSGVRGGISVTDDLEHFEFISSTLPDNRNLVLFPEKIDRQYIRLERPFANYLRDKKDQFDIWISSSPDLIHWGNSRRLVTASEVSFCNNKIGPGTPPIKTEHGWLSVFHTVTEDRIKTKNGWEKVWNKIYMAGLMLQDLNNPYKILGIYNEPLIVPEAAYETRDGFRNNVIFPGGIILEEDSEVKIYYGAADTVQCVACARLEDLINLCLEI